MDENFNEKNNSDDNNDYPHLDEQIKHYLRESDASRINFIRQSKFYTYSVAKELLSELDLLMQPTNNNRIQGMVISAEPNNGKSELVRRFAKTQKYLPVERSDGTGINVPIVLIDAPHRPNESWLIGEILTALNAPYRTNGDLEAKIKQVLGLFKRLNVRMLIIDEISDLVSGSAIKQRDILTLIKQISTRCKVVIVLTGVPSIKAALAVNDQINSRFVNREIPKWKESVELRQLLKIIERRTPLKNPSMLAAQENAPLLKTVLERSKGRIGWIIEILQRSAVQAITSKKEKIDFETVNSIRL